MPILLETRPAQSMYVQAYRSTMMDQQDNSNQQDKAKSRKDKGKLVFLVIIAVAVALVYMSQQSGAELPKWSDDLPKALAQAKQEDRKVLVFFAGKPPSNDARLMSTKTLKMNAKQIEKGKFIKVLIQIAKTDELAKRYDIKTLPTFLLLDAQGVELNRRVGFVGQVPFAKGFLDCSEVQKP